MFTSTCLQKQYSQASLSFPSLVICHIKIVKYINKKNSILEIDNIYNRNKYRKF